MKSGLVLFLLSYCGIFAAEIRWTGSGTVDGITGAGFAGSAQVGDPVAIALSYDSGTRVKGRSRFPIGSGEYGNAWFYGQANLSITVTIGESVWRGEMATVAETTNVMESTCWDFGGSPDWFKVKLDEARGGVYPSFPGGGTARALEIELRDDESPAELFSIHQLPDTLSCLAQLTSASGAVRAGTDSISFTLDPASVRVMQPQVPVSIARLPEGVELSWPTEDGKNYRLESTSNLQCWEWDGEYAGDGNPISQIFTPLAGDPRRFFRVVEN